MASLSVRDLSPPSRLLVIGSVPVLLIAVATVGYRMIEGWPWFDAFYTAVSTLTSIGADMHVPSNRGRTFTIVLSLGGIFSFALAATEIIRTIVTGDLRTYLETRRMKKRIDDLEGHVIVCGYGRVGRYACEQLLSAGIPFVVVDRADLRLTAAREAGAYPVAGDATADATLRRSGIDRARALVSAVGVESENVLITMTARLLNPTLTIVARAAEEMTVPKLKRAGASTTVSPYVIGGVRMAQAVLRPALVDLIDAATRTDLVDLQIEEHLVRPGSAFDGETVGACGLRALGLLPIAIRRPDGAIVFNPEDDAPIAAGDILIVLGCRVQMARAVELAFSRRSDRASQRSGAR